MTAPELIWAASERGAGWHYGYWDTGGQSDLNDREQYTRTSLTIRRDDPVLKQVMEALESIGRTYAANQSRLIHNDTQIKAMAHTALAALKEYIGGTNGQTD